MTDLEEIGALVDRRAETYIALADEVWRAAELNWREISSARAVAGRLAQEGFVLQQPACGMETAFIAQWKNGTGGPVIAFLCEYDALPGLSQQPGLDEPQPLCAGAPGHGCGHNLLGAGSAAAAAAFKDWCTAHDVAATVRCYGCPAEEDGGGKVFFAKAGAFDDVDAVLAWHPGDVNYVLGQGCLAVTGVTYRFTGKAAHAASAPYAGRSALDACELMNVGCNYLREHIIPTARLHYAYRDTGGTAPNVVPAHACLHYYIRAPKVTQMMEIKSRVDDVARGAALMTGTRLEIRAIDGFSDYVPNRTLSQVLADTLRQAGAPAWDAEDRALAARFAATMTPEERAGNLAASLESAFAPMEIYEGGLLDGTTAAYVHRPELAEPGSTDVGDVSYCAPTAQLYAACQVLGTAGHSWQVTAQSASSIGRKGMLKAAQVLAGTAARLAGSPRLLAQAREEHRRACPNGYCSPMPADARPEPAAEQ